MRSIKILFRQIVPLLSIVACGAAHSQSRLTTDVPSCRMPPGIALPDKYYRLAGANHEFRWVLKAAADSQLVEGEGWERIDGSSMHDWFAFYRIDLNGDGYCDWYLNAAAPMSSGGDRDSINTIYLGGANGWSRIGPTMPGDKPDQLGFGKAYAEQRQYLFGEEPAVVHDAASKTNYIITALYERNVQHDGRPGYRIFDWDAGKKTLRLLDKWAPGSKAAEVYAFFKVHGARKPAPASAAAADNVQLYDPAVEAYELKQACDPQSELRSFADSDGGVSPHLLARCKR